MNILITGGAGFIGTNTALAFKAMGHHITCVDNLSRQGVSINASTLQKQHIKLIKANVADVSLYAGVLNQADCVIHLAGQTAVTTSITHPAKDFEANLHSTFILLEAIRQNNLQVTFIYSSTNKVYGDLTSHQYKKDKTRYYNLTAPNGIAEEEPLDFISPYGCSKGAADQYVHDFHRIYGLKTVVFRQSCIYGPYQQGVEDQGWVAHFTKNAILNLPITIFGDGLQVRDVLYITDLIEAYQLVIENIDHIQGEVFNIGGGKAQSYSLMEVVKKINQKLKINCKINYQDERLGDQKVFISDNHKLKSKIGWQPSTDFTTGLDNLLSWQRKFIRV
jgi:CDP-paratose 2-epimerase